MKKNNKSRGISLIAFLIGLTLIFCTGGYVFYRDQKMTMILEKYNELAAISKLKVNQIVNWRNERLGDANTIYNNRLTIEAIQRYINGTGSDEDFSKTKAWLISLQKFYDYGSFLFLDKNLHLLFSSDPLEPLGEYGKKICTLAITEKRIILSDLHATSLIGPHIDLVIPLYTSPENQIGFVGVVYLRIDPDKFLFPLIQSWPAISRSSETLLVRREGNNVLFLNELRFKKNTALNLVFPLTNTLLPATMAALGTTGIVEGTDYRGIKVLANIQQIPDTPWFMITKVDTVEIFQPVRKQALWIFSFTLMLVFIGALITYFLRRRHLLKAEIEQMVLQQHFDFLVKYANDVIILADSHGNIKEINDKAISIYGYERKELLGLNIRDLRASESLNSIQELLDLLNKKEDGIIFETLQIRKNGEIFPAEISSRILDVNGIKFYQAIIRDITERKKTEEQLRETHDYLENLFSYSNVPIIVWDTNYKITRFNHAFEQLTGKTAKEVTGKKIDLLFPDNHRLESMEFIRQTLTQLKSTNHELESFAYSVSHDLRAPLRGIDGWSLALLEDFGSQLDKNAQQYLSRVRSETQRMGHLIDDMLKLSKVTRVEINKENINLSEIAWTIITHLQEVNPNLIFEFTVQPGLTVVGDPQMIEIALTNLLDNAVKFTARRPVARIGFGSSYSGSEQNYYIRDNGVGFNMTYAKNLFGAFQRMHKQTEFLGTGIGPATVQRIVHRHGGKIQAEAKIDEGATFYFTIGKQE